MLAMWHLDNLKDKLICNRFSHKRTMHEDLHFIKISNKFKSRQSNKYFSKVKFKY